MSNIFEQLAPLAETKKQQTTVAKFIEKGFKFTRQPDAQKFTFLVYDFFVAGNMPAVQLCIDYLVAQGYPTAENEKKFLNWVFYGAGLLSEVLYQRCLYTKETTSRPP